MKKKNDFIYNDIRYYMRGNPNGYGSEIMQIDNGRYKSIFRSLDKDTVLYQFSCIENANDPTTFKFPDISGEIDMMKVLIIKAKYYTYHYSVPTHKIFHKAFRKFLTIEYGNNVDNFKPSKPKNDTGIERVEDLELIAIKNIRNDIELKWKEYENKLKKYKEELNDWANLKNVVTTDNDGIAIDAVEYIDGNDIWELINLDIV